MQTRKVLIVASQMTGCVWEKRLNSTLIAHTENSFMEALKYLEDHKDRPPLTIIVQEHGVDIKEKKVPASDIPKELKKDPDGFSFIAYARSKGLIPENAKVYVVSVTPKPFFDDPRTEGITMIYDGGRDLAKKMTPNLQILRGGGQPSRS